MFTDFFPIHYIFTYCIILTNKTSACFLLSLTHSTFLNINIYSLYIFVYVYEMYICRNSNVCTMDIFIIQILKLYLHNDFSNNNIVICNKLMCIFFVSFQGELYVYVHVYFFIICLIM